MVNDCYRELQLHHEVIRELIGNNSFVYLDVPFHDNVGDLLIMLGTLKFFDKNSIKPRLISSARGHIGDIDKNEIILLHGGGNLGDLYDLHQNFRNNVISQFKENKIIVLPQTIYFDDDDNYKKCCDSWSAHKDLHIFVRDETSLQLAKEMSDNVYLVPDMAHQLYPVTPTKASKKEGVLGVIRQDKEAKELTVNQLSYKTDWSQELSKHKLGVKLFVSLDRYLAKIGLTALSNIISKAWILYSKYLVRKIVNLYSGYDEIHTNRLHGHILATLMDKKHTVDDNSYGKNFNYIKCWTKKFISNSYD